MEEKIIIVKKLIKKIALLFPPLKRLKRRIDDMRNQIDVLCNQVENSKNQIESIYSQINTSNIEKEELLKIIEQLRSHLDLANVRKYRSCINLERFHVNFNGSRTVNDKEEEYMAFCCEYHTDYPSVGLYEEVEESIRKYAEIRTGIIAESKMFKLISGGGIIVNI